MSRILLSIDPGSWTGWALFIDEELFACGRVTSEHVRTLPFLEDGLDLTDMDVIVEVPIMYDTSREKNPNSVFRNGVLSGQIKGMYAAMGATVEEVSPARKWKGSIPKPAKGEVYIIEHRLMKRLSEQEKALVLATIGKRQKQLDHNVVDAVAMGKWKMTEDKL